ncbi:dispanin subfamily A member 2b-like [Spinachia spinachia]
MDPARYPAECVTLQGRNEGHPEPPAGPMGVQYTSLNIPQEPPKDYVIWSIFNFFHCNPCCLGLAALAFSIKARDRKVAGDVMGGRHYGSTARCLNIWASVLLVAFFLILIIAYGVVAQRVGRAYGFHNNNYQGYGML